MKIYMMNVRYLENEATYKKYSGSVSGERREKAGRFYRACDRALSLGAGLLLEYGMKMEGIRKNSPLVYACGKFEKPYLEEHPDIFFNLSHSGEYAVCVIQRNKAAGIDIEKTAVLDDSIARQCFTEEEYACILRSKDPEKTFFRIWVLKEAYTKALGLGLNKPLRDFSICVGDGISFADRAETGQWFFREYTPAPGYFMAVCSGADTFASEIHEVAEKDLVCL